ncbi:hypothetical protein [Clostridium akagii]|uniref:hypothetical protein n=1 Tax=Clostridium akagii TaxID=91623 RepID=UPI0012EBEE76|nr:hypothetical protein [Clostridium akagii]
MFTSKNNLAINVWDGFFSVITYPAIILCVYLPVVVIVTSIINKKIGCNQHLIVRSRKKILWIASRLVVNLIIGLLLTTIFFLSTFVISYIFFGFEANWSSTATNIKPLDIFFLSNFVSVLTPVQATLISFSEIYIATAIIISFRDALSNYISSIYICDLIVIIYIFASIIEYMYSMTIGIFKIFNYISLNTIAIIYFHKFGNTKMYNITLTQSFIISLILLSIFISTNLIFIRKLEVKCD